jgi:hypothetical protein
MPWKIEHNGGDCSGDKPWAVVKTSDGSVAGCHATKASAKDQLAALYSSEDKSRWWCRGLLK